MRLVRSTSKYDVLKEPRGFVRVLQLVFAIFAFASTTSFQSHINIFAECEKPQTVNLTLSYPFALTALGKCSPICHPESPLYGDYSSNARFYVFVGVITFLYCVGILVLYTVFVDKYEENVLCGKADFGLSALITLLWFIASVVWASGVDHLKRYTSAEVLKEEICRNQICIIDTSQSYAGLNISLVFGFSNTALWAASLWFLWKETPWFRGQRDSQQPEEGLPQVDDGPL